MKRMGWLDKTILLLPARNHEQHRQQLRTQHGIVVPRLQAHYDPTDSWRLSDLCPVEFSEPAPIGQALMVVHRYMSNPFVLYCFLFRLTVWLLSFVIPWLKRFPWLIAGPVTLARRPSMVDYRYIMFAGVDYKYTLERALNRINYA